MNHLDTARQINKYKSSITRLRLARYALIISSFFTLSTLSSGLSQHSLLAFSLSIPIPIYFYLQCRKHRNRQLKLKSFYQTVVNYSQIYDRRFSLSSFMTQPNFSFRLSLFLILLVIITSVARIHTDQPTLSQSNTNITAKQ